MDDEEIPTEFKVVDSIGEDFDGDATPSKSESERRGSRDRDSERRSHKRRHGDNRYR